MKTNEAPKRPAYGLDAISKVTFRLHKDQTEIDGCFYVIGNVTRMGSRLNAVRQYICHYHGANEANGDDYLEILSIEVPDDYVLIPDGCGMEMMRTVKLVPADMTPEDIARAEQREAEYEARRLADSCEDIEE